jgi:O-antigen ligase
MGTGLLQLPPYLAFFVYSVFIVCLFWADRRREAPVSPWLWVPTIWMALGGSRPLDLWFVQPGSSLAAASFEQGSTLEALVYSVLISAGVFILFQRKEKFNLPGLIAANWPLFLLLGYYALAILWSDFPFVSFKRYIKLLGVVIMVLVILTEDDAASAFRTAARRCGYVLLPLSIVLAKYFPSGATYDEWTGVRFVVGIAEDKNTLGQICLVLGLIYLWDLILVWKDRFPKRDWIILFMDVSVLFFAIYLLKMARSATSLVCLTFGSVVLLATSYSSVLKRIGLYIILGSLALLVLNYVFDLYGTMLAALGKDTTMTGRTDIWKQLLSFAENPLFGTGYESFWTPSRLLLIRETRHINEAHNGYLEIYLNTGLVGLFLFSIFLFSAYRRCKEIVRLKPEYGRFAMAFFFTVILYNCAEAAFKALCLLFFVCLTIGLRLPETNDERVVYGAGARAPGLPAGRAL